MVGHMLTMLMPQAPKPVVRMVTRVAAESDFLPGMAYRPVQIRPMRPIFRKVAAKPPRSKQLVEPLLGLLMIFHRPVSIWARSGMHTAATRKLQLKQKKNSRRNFFSGS